MIKERSKQPIKGETPLQFDEVIKRIAETYRADARRLNCETCGEVFERYGYDTNDLKEEIYFSYFHDFTESEIDYFYDCSIMLKGGV